MRFTHILFVFIAFFIANIFGVPINPDLEVRVGKTHICEDLCRQDGGWAVRLCCFVVFKTSERSRYVSLTICIRTCKLNLDLTVHRLVENATHSEETGATLDSGWTFSTPTINRPALLEASQIKNELE